MMTIRNKTIYSSEIINLDEVVPKDHFLRIINKYFDWDFIYDEVKEQYSKLGRASIDPVVLFKIHILKFLFHEDSLRNTYEMLQYNMLYRWFIGYELNEKTPNHSTYSQNYKRKFNKLENDILQTVFDKVIDLLIEHNCINMTEVYIDSTHTKANANKKKNHKEIIQIEAKKYQRELELEIALKALNEEDLTEEQYLEEVERIVKCNEEIPTEELLGEKEIIVSNTDCDAGVLYKSEKEKMFAYNTSVICDNNNYILSVECNPSNMHDSVAFYGIFNKFIGRFNIENVTHFVGDSAYKTPHICKTLIDLGMIPVLPYTRPKGKKKGKEEYKKYDYVYDETNDIYICPNEKDLIPTSINKDGYVIYKSSINECKDCPFKEKCTKTKYKQILRHIWENYKDKAEEYRYQLDIQEIYKQRPSHIERVFADGKMKYGLKSTYFKGKERVARELTLLYACMNLKKFASHHY